MPSAYLSALNEAPKADVLREVERQMDRARRYGEEIERLRERVSELEDIKEVLTRRINRPLGTRRDR